MTWLFNNSEFKLEDLPDENIMGFVYLITNTKTNKKYVGKKILYNTIKRPPLKGKKRRRISKVESDWKEYYGSNEVLKQEASIDKSIFKREILHFCYYKTEMSYLETEELFKRGVLLSDEYYNGWITCKITRRGLDGIAIRRS